MAPTYRKAAKKCDKLSNIYKSGTLTQSNEGPPGETYVHVALKQLYKLRERNLDFICHNRLKGKKPVYVSTETLSNMEDTSNKFIHTKFKFNPSAQDKNKMMHGSLKTFNSMKNPNQEFMLSEQVQLPSLDLPRISQ